MFRNYLLVAIRNLLRNKGFSIINISGLAFGMACFMTILLYVQFELSFDTFHENADRIFKLVEIQTFKGRSPEHVGVTQGPMGPAMLEDFPEVVAFVRFWNKNSLLVEFRDQKLRVDDARYVDPAFLRVFSFPPISGDIQTALDEPGSVVLTVTLARKIFGDEDPLGKILHFEDRDHTVKAVLDNVPRNSSLRFEMLISTQTLKGGDNPPGGNWGSNWLTTFLMLAEGANYKALEAKFPGFLQKYMADSVDHYVLYLHPLKNVHLYSGQINYDQANWDRSDITYVYLFSVVAVFVLLIACINFVNLSTARSAGRAREVGMRKVVGAHRVQLIRQFLGESMLLSLVALLFSFGLTELSVPLFNSLSGLALDFHIWSDPLFALGILSVTVFVGVLSGCYPALYLSSMQPVWVLKGAPKGASRGTLLRKGLVVVQFLISVFLIIGTGLVVEQFRYMRNKNMGFQKDQVVTVWLNRNIQRNLESLKSELMQHPAIVDVAASQRRFGQFLSESIFTFEGAGSEDRWLIPKHPVGYDFMPFYGLELVEGRNFSPEFPTDAASPTRAFILNETLVKQMGWDSAVGRKFKFRGDEEWGTVIGVVKDFNYYSLHHKIEPLVVYCKPSHYWTLSVKIRPEQTAEALAFLSVTWKRWRPNDTFSYEFLDAYFARLYASEERSGRIFGVFAMLAIIIACLGMFGLASYTAEQRTKEIGIRKVLGASVPNILGLMSQEFIKLVVLANLVACPMVYVAGRHWLQDFAYRIDIEVGIFVVGGVLTVAIALLTVSFQAVKAARADPVDALRYE